MTETVVSKGIDTQDFQKEVQRKNARNFLHACLLDGRSRSNDDGMDVKIEDDSVEVTDKHMPKHYFRGFIDSQHSGRVLGLSIVNEVTGEEKSPFIWSADFIYEVFEYFGGQEEITGIRGHWNKRSKNFKDLIRHLGQTFDLEVLDKEPNKSSEQVKSALRATWTGKIAVALGYTEPHVLERTWDDVKLADQSIEVIFRKKV